MKINFSESEFNVLKKVLNYYKIDPLFVEKDDIVLDDNVASFFREIIGNYLAIFGFDKDYKATPEGIILEILVDKLYTE
jgi:hypothetical protein